MRDPRTMLREIAGKLDAVFSSATREDTIAATNDWHTRSIQYGAWLMQRERGLRARLQQTLKQNAEYEARIRQLEGGHEKTGLRAPVMRKPSKVEAMAAELRELSKEIVFEGAMLDAFDAEDVEWFETETSDGMG